MCCFPNCIVSVLHARGSNILTKRLTLQTDLLCNEFIVLQFSILTSVFCISLSYNLFVLTQAETSICLPIVIRCYVAFTRDVFQHRTTDAQQETFYMQKRNHFFLLLLFFALDISNPRTQRDLIPCTRVVPRRRY